MKACKNKSLQVYIMVKYLCKNVHDFQCTEHSQLQMWEMLLFYPNALIKKTIVFLVWLILGKSNENFNVKICFDIWITFHQKTRKYLSTFYR